MKPAARRICTSLAGWFLLSLTAQRRTQTNRVNGRKEIIRMQSIRTRRAAKSFFIYASPNIRKCLYGLSGGRFFRTLCIYTLMNKMNLSYPTLQKGETFLFFRHLCHPKLCVLVETQCYVSMPKYNV